MGRDTFMVSTGSQAPTSNAVDLLASSGRTATAYCAGLGKDMVLADVQQQRPHGFTSNENVMIFRCVAK